LTETYTNKKETIALASVTEIAWLVALWYPWVAMAILQGMAITVGVVKVTNLIPYLWILISLPYKCFH